MKNFITLFQKSLLIPLLAIFLFSSQNSLAQELVTGISHEKIYITSDFTGSEMIVFGTINGIENLIAQGGKNAVLDRYKVVVAVEGPEEPGVVRKKANILGIWINRDNVAFTAIPSSYLMMTSYEEKDENFKNTLEELRVGLDHTPFGLLDAASDGVSIANFRNAVIRLKEEKNLYKEMNNGIHFIADNLFKAKFDIPALIPVGDHVITTYLFEDNKVLSKTSHKVTITKTGFEQLMYDFSRNYGYIYGIVCVFLAMVTGWLSSVIFKRD